MKIGLIIYGSLDLVTGGFLYGRLLVEYLRNQGDQVEVISLPWPTYRRGLLDNCSRAFRKRLEGLECDVLLQDELVHPSFFRLNRRLRRRLDCPIIALVYHLRGNEVHPPWRRRFYRWVEGKYLDTVDGYVCISRAIKEDVERLAGNHRPLMVAPGGGDRLPGDITLEGIAARALAPGPLEIVFIANVIPRKELHTLIEALASLPRAGWRLTVAGSLTMDVPYVEDIRSRIKQAGFAGKVHLAGTLESEDLAGLLARSHVLAVPSSYEAFGIVYLEGMSFGLPAIASTAGGAGEIIHHGVDGFLVTPGDVPALAGHLERLLLDRGLLLKMSLAARANFRRHPTWEESLSSIHRFIHSFRGS
ncbi:MAG: glycosyltransferase family 1 protein [Deltaproteobacteria bacterium]|nr:MAG: glycosyltransferase family 1 protein [Deltaproteobacteria bacterium]